MMLLYLYFHLLHSILGLKCNVYATYVVARVPDFEYLIVDSSLFTVCFNQRNKIIVNLSMDTKFCGQ